MENGADINKVDELYGVTPLYLAEKNNFTEAAKILIENGAEDDGHLY